MSSFFLQLALLLISFTSAVASSELTSDRLTLLSIRSLLSDPQRALASWTANDSRHHCSWRGVTCDVKSHVTALDLSSMNLSGSISAQIANLTFLRRIHLADNQLHGHIPLELGRLSHLRYLNLSINSLNGSIPATLSHCSWLHALSMWNNSLQGEIPLNLSSHLQSIGLQNNFLSGQIPAEFGSFPKLKLLILSNNQLTGSMPVLLGCSPSLAHVDLWSNKLSGSISPFLFNSSLLHYLDLSNNNLNGLIPSSLGNTSSLVYLDLSNNGLSGGIPPFSRIDSRLELLGLSVNQLDGSIPLSLGNLSSLINLYLDQNHLEGSIPDLGSIPYLQGLDLTINNLSGQVPPSLYNLSSLTYFGVGENRLSGSLPADVGFTLPNLQSLVLQGNHFHGAIPTSLCNISGLQMLDLANNTFSGLVPSNLGSLRSLQKLNLGWNSQLQAHDWSFLASLTNCSHLERLYLRDIKLEGTLPSLVGNLSTNLQWLVMGNNNLHGVIPPEICNLVNLTVLFLGPNNFTGNIPNTIGNLWNLVALNLAGNKFSGTIPTSIGNLTRLNELYMDANELNGSIPASFGLARNLEVMNLSHNSLIGSIPKEIGSLTSLTEFLVLSHNSLNGSVPLEVGRLINLVWLDISENQLSGDIPSTISSCSVLQYLLMEGNLFQGSIPQSFRSLRGILKLDLSRNNLTGEIPDFLASLSSLKYLDLSFNDFEGEVPKDGVFGNTSEIFIIGNLKLCGGNPILRFPSCPVQSSGRSMKSKIIIIVIPIVCGVIILLSCLFLYQRRKAVELYHSSPLMGYMKVSYTDILKATREFSSANLIGTGSYGSVYKGKLDFEKSLVAVKVLHLHQSGALRSFVAECEVLRKIRHRNLIKIITLCSTVDNKGKDFKALIFDYMPNGSLESWLHPNDHAHHQPRSLSLIQRLNIASDVASALEYLHHNCAPPVVHCDLKPSNILLNIDMTALVGDFGLARFLSASIPSTSRMSTSFMGLKGSIGYVAPEYGIGSEISTQGDAYSFGVLLLEILTGKRPTDGIFKDGLNLHKFVEMAFPQRVMEILDPHILQDMVDEGEHSNTGNICVDRPSVWRCIVPLFRIGLSCSKESPRERMEMKDVSLAIHAIREEF